VYRSCAPKSYLWCLATLVRCRVWVRTCDHDEWFASVIEVVLVQLNRNYEIVHTGSDTKASTQTMPKLPHIRDKPVGNLAERNQNANPKRKPCKHTHITPNQCNAIDASSSSCSLIDWSPCASPRPRALVHPSASPPHCRASRSSSSPSLSSS
jgi:hypothetical protein